MSDPTQAELEAVAAKIDAHEIAEFRKGMEAAHWREVVNKTATRLWWACAPDALDKAVAALPVMELIPEEGRMLFVWRSLSHRNRRALMVFMANLPVMRPGTMIDAVTGETVPMEKPHAAAE